MIKKKKRINERDLICESLLNKTFKIGTEISGFSGYRIEVINDKPTSSSDKIGIIYVKLENGIIIHAK